MSKDPPVIRCIARSRQKYYHVVLCDRPPVDLKAEGTSIARFIGLGDAWHFAMHKQRQLTSPGALPCALIVIR